jgi:hypothetical protein
MSFNDVTARIQQRVNQQVRYVTIGVFSSVIKMTPVDTGRAKGNWQCTIGSPAMGENEQSDPEGSMIATVPNEAGQKVYLTNNVPYIQTLEYGRFGTGDGATTKTTRDGFSIQAPYGMVRISIDRFAEVV